jgi:hypothetical protein
MVRTLRFTTDQVAVMLGVNLGSLRMRLKDDPQPCFPNPGPCKTRLWTWTQIEACERYLNRKPICPRPRRHK